MNMMEGWATSYCHRPEEDDPVRCNSSQLHQALHQQHRRSRSDETHYTSCCSESLGDTLHRQAHRRATSETTVLSGAREAQSDMGGRHQYTYHSFLANQHWSSSSADGAGANALNSAEKATDSAVRRRSSTWACSKDALKQQIRYLRRKSQPYNMDGSGSCSQHDPKLRMLRPSRRAPPAPDNDDASQTTQSSSSSSSSNSTTSTSRAGVDDLLLSHRQPTSEAVRPTITPHGQVSMPADQLTHAGVRQLGNEGPRSATGLGPRPQARLPEAGEAVETVEAAAPRQSLMAKCESTQAPLDAAEAASGEADGRGVASGHGACGRGRNSESGKPLHVKQTERPSPPPKPPRRGSSASRTDPLVPPPGLANVVSGGVQEGKEEARLNGHHLPDPPRPRTQPSESSPDVDVPVHLVAPPPPPDHDPETPCPRQGTASPNTARHFLSLAPRARVTAYKELMAKHVQEMSSRQTGIPFHATQAAPQSDAPLPLHHAGMSPAAFRDFIQSRILAQKRPQDLPYVAGVVQKAMQRRYGDARLDPKSPSRTCIAPGRRTRRCWEGTEADTEVRQSAECRVDDGAAGACQVEALDAAGAGAPGLSAPSRGERTPPRTRQQQLMCTLSVPLPRQMYAGPERPLAADPSRRSTNLTGRQRPPPDDQPASVLGSSTKAAKDGVRISIKQWQGFIKSMDDFTKKRRAWHAQRQDEESRARKAKSQVVLAPKSVKMMQAAAARRKEQGSIYQRLFEQSFAGTNASYFYDASVHSSSSQYFICRSVQPSLTAEFTFRPFICPKSVKILAAKERRLSVTAGYMKPKSWRSAKRGAPGGGGTGFRQADVPRLQLQGQSHAATATSAFDPYSRKPSLTFRPQLAKRTSAILRNSQNTAIKTFEGRVLNSVLSYYLRLAQAAKTPSPGPGSYNLRRGACSYMRKRCSEQVRTGTAAA